MYDFKICDSENDGTSVWFPGCFNFGMNIFISMFEIILKNHALINFTVLFYSILEYECSRARSFTTGDGP